MPCIKQGGRALLSARAKGAAGRGAHLAGAEEQVLVHRVQRQVMDGFAMAPVGLQRTEPPERGVLMAPGTRMWTMDVCRDAVGRGGGGGLPWQHNGSTAWPARS